MQRLHIAFAGEFMGHYWFIIIDAHSKWTDIMKTNNESTETALRCLRSSFASNGLPKTLHSDNGRAFFSHEFEDFCQMNGIKHTLSGSYHPATNGLAERAVQNFKKAMKKTPGDLDYRLGRVLFKYRTTIQETTGKAPSFLLNGQELRSRLDLMRPEHDVKRQIQYKLETKVSANGKIRELEIGDNVGIHNEASRYPKWVKGVVLRRLGGRTYEILRENGLKSTKHIDTLRKWLGTTKQTARCGN